MRPYELTFVLSGKLAPALQKTVVDKIKKQVETGGGKWEEVEEAGKKSLSYPINKESTGFYFFAKVQLLPGEVQGVDRMLTVEDNVLRHLIVQVKSQKEKVKSAKTKTRKKAVK